jgi:hypothetical protein
VFCLRYYDAFVFAQTLAAFMRASHPRRSQIVAPAPGSLACALLWSVEPGPSDRDLPLAASHGRFAGLEIPQAVTAIVDSNAILWHIHLLLKYHVGLVGSKPQAAASCGPSNQKQYSRIPHPCPRSVFHVRFKCFHSAPFSVGRTIFFCGCRACCWL